MSDIDNVDFETDHGVPTDTRFGVAAVENRMAGWLVRHKIAKSQKQAQYILLGIIGIAVVVTALMWQVATPQGGPTPQQQEALQHSSGPMH